MASKRILSITDISSTGQGIAKLDGKIYFVTDAWPSQTVEATIIQEKKRYVLSKMTALLEDSAPSRPYLCPHTQCGGCTLRYIPYHEQCLYKQQLLQNAFLKITKEEVPCYPIQAITQHIPYRNKVEFHYGYTIDGNQDIGFYTQLSHTVIPITHCPLIPNGMIQILSIARQQLAISKTPVYYKNTGFWRHLVIRYSTHYKQYMIHCITAPDPFYYEHVTSLFSALTEEFPDAICVHSIRKNPLTFAYGEKYITPHQKAYLTDTISVATKTIHIRYGANCFFQNNYEMMHKLYSAIETLCRHKHAYLDICTGVGSIALTCFQNATNILGIDSIQESIQYAHYNAKYNGIDADFKIISMKNLHVKFLQGIHAVCVDPPRRGLHPKLIHVLLNSRIQYIIYVSCNPATMARDCTLLQQAYTIRHSTPFDMFPHTVHCESLTLLERR